LVGEPLIDENESLHSEVQLLLDILGRYSEEVRTQLLLFVICSDLCI
jgi:hypothetical protein